MTITHDKDTGWTESIGDPHWRATTAAFNRLSGATVYWHSGAHGVVTAHLASGVPVVIIRRYLAHKRWSVKFEGFEFWQFVRLLDKEAWTSPMGFDSAKAAKDFASLLLKQVGAKVLARKPSSVSL